MTVGDQELATRAALGCDHSFAVLEARLRGLRHWICSGYFLAGADHDDLLQEATVGLLKACHDFEPGHGSFRTFAELCMRRQAITAVLTATRRKHQPLNDATPLDKPVLNAAGDEMSLLDILPGREPEHLDELEARRALRELAHAIESELTPAERRAVLGRLNGLSYEQIGPRKPVDNALQRARRKLQVVVERKDLAA